MNATSVASLGHIHAFLEHALTITQTTLDRLPGSADITTHGARWSLFSSPLLFALSSNPQFSEKVRLLGENRESFDIEAVDVLVDK
ncbi:hypothetical protein CVT25_015905 [Psilocybe cyanescens]|uniref:Uncharacterized protein n=1 Tax=Psilocybe cyanescens TaxID=93625 RepID=A0A409WS94_PSICY|nr:hypothetical protein CVT25_015905 [Psilocybe cyanescens]